MLCLIQNHCVFFEAAFDIDMMMACCGTDKEWKIFGKEAINKLRFHFADLFSPEEYECMTNEYKVLKKHIKKIRALHKTMKGTSIYSGVLANAEDLGMTNISLLLEIMFYISPSTAYVERSFSCMNAIKTKHRSSLTSDLLNKLMWICQTDLPIDANDVLDLWIELSSEGGKSLIIDQIRIPSIFKVRKGYKKNRKAAKKRKL